MTLLQARSGRIYDAVLTIAKAIENILAMNKSLTQPAVGNDGNGLCRSNVSVVKPWIDGKLLKDQMKKVSGVLWTAWTLCGCRCCYVKKSPYQDQTTRSSNFCLQSLRLSQSPSRPSQLQVTQARGTSFRSPTTCFAFDFRLHRVSFSCA